MKKQTSDSREYKNYLAQKRTLQSICAECGRRDKVPFAFCSDCLNEMKMELFNKTI